MNRLAESTAALGHDVAPFVEHYLANWTPYKAGWNYEDGCIHEGVLALARASGDPRPFEFVQREIGSRVDALGRIAGLDVTEYNIDNVKASRCFFPLLEATAEPRYRLAMDHAWAQLESHPRTHGGNYWHKRIYPWQVWLDGLYMAQPFQLAYARIAHRPELIDDSLRQFSNVRAVMRDARSGLSYHGWDESRTERWSDPRTGCSPCFWGRAMGWYVMALADGYEALGPQPGLPEAAPASRALLGTLLLESCDALLRVRSREGLWYQVLDQGSREGNYEEASASLMIAYALMKGARLGALPSSRGAAGEHALAACVARFLTGRKLDGICGVAGLGNVPYRDGSYAYYLSEKIVPNDPKGVGALFMAVAEWIAARR